MTKRRKPNAQRPDEAAPAGAANNDRERNDGDSSGEALRQRLKPVGGEAYMPTDVLLRKRLFDYVEGCLTPQRMAELRRGRGDAAASPRDYDCRCPVPKADALPDCRPNRAECRFRHLMRPRPKVCDNRFAHALAREIWDQFWERWPQTPEPEKAAMIEKAIAFSLSEGRRFARIRAEPEPEPAPLMENWRWCDVR